MVASLETPAGAEVRVEANVRQPQKRCRVERDRSPRVVVDARRMVLSDFVRPDLAVLFKPDRPHAKSLADFFDIVDFQPTMDIERRQTRE